MRHSSRIVLVTVCLSILVITAGFMTHSTLAHWLADLSGHILTPITQSIGRGQALIAILSGHGDLVQENLNLKTELARAQAAVAQTDELIQENKFLRASAGLRNMTGRSPIEANIFGYLRDSGLREVVLNKGRTSNIEPGDIVMTAQGALLGLVKDVSEEHSVIRTIGDPSLEITARVVGTDIAGLLRMDAKEGLILDMVQKAETVSEGQAIATSGNDNLPAGILIGTVRSVDTESATLFKIVRISPAIADDFSGKVLVFHP